MVSVLPELVSALRGHAVLILGDVMLDEYIWGQVRRISPEAPVPVVEATRRTYAPGGAANVATNVAMLGGQVFLASVIGQDYSADSLRQELTQRGVSVNGLVVCAERPTTTKTRVIAHSQQVARVDSEVRQPIPSEIENALEEWIATHLPQVQACIISDYGKGVLSARLTQELIQAARRAGKPIVVDPKGTDYSKYCGATLVTPNLHEAEQATNRQANDEMDLERIAKELLDILRDSALLVTRGADGMSLFANAIAPVHIPSVARQVFDVTGAGDTVIGTLALALAAGAPLESAIRLANIAAGIVVGKVGTAGVTPEELLHAVREHYD